MSDELRSDLLASNDVVWSGELPGGARASIRELNGADLDFIRGKAARGGVDETAVLARIAVASLCDSDGSRLFSAKDIPAVNKMSLARLRKIAELAEKYGGLVPEDTKELEGNSEATTPSGYGTD